jgi:hypothetical protein
MLFDHAECDYTLKAKPILLYAGEKAVEVNTGGIN